METIDAGIDASHGALLRLIGTIERRGWVVRGMDMTPLEAGGSRLVLTLERTSWHGGSLDVLLRHLEKLVSVTSVSARAPQPAAQSRIACTPQPLPAATPRMGAAAIAMGA